MEKKKANRVLAFLAAVAVIAAAAFCAVRYGTQSVSAHVILPARQAEVETALQEIEAEEHQAEEQSEPPVMAEEEPAVQVVTADMELDLLTGSGLYPEQEAAQAVSVYDLTQLPEPEPEPAYTEPVYTAPAPQPVPAPAPAPVQPEPVPVQPAPAPVQPEPAPQPVLTDNQQEGCVGDGLTY